MALTATQTAEARRTAGEAVLRPDIKVNRASTPEQKKAAKLQQSVKEQPRVAIEDMSVPDPIDPSAVTKSEENFSFKKADGSTDTSKYATERGHEKAAIKEVIDYLDNGVRSAAIEQKVLDHLGRDPLIKTQLERLAGAGNPIDLTNPDIKAAIQKVLENPVYMQNLRDQLKGKLEHTITDLGDNLGVKERAHDEAQRKWKKADDELKVLNGSVTTKGSLAEKTQRLNTEFTPAVGGGVATKADKIAAIETNEGTLNREISTYQAAQDKDNTRLSTLRAQRDAFAARGKTAEATTAQTEIDAIETAMKERESLEIKPREAQINELNALRKERDDLKKEVEETVPQKIEQLTQELVGLNEAKFATQAEFEKANLEFQEQIEKRVKGFQGLMGSEAVKFIRDEIGHAQGIEQTRLEKEITKAEAAGDKQMADLLRSMETRWSSPKEHRVQKWKDDEIKVDKEKVRPDFDVLLSGGPDELGKAMFYEKDAAGNVVRRVNPDTGRRYTKDEIDATMQKDSFKNVQDEAVQRVLGNAIKLGLTDGKEGQILQSAWGVAALQKAREWNKAVDEQLKLFEKHSGIKNILDPKNIAEMTKKHKKFSFWLLLTMMSPGLGFIVGSGLLTKNMLTSDGGHGEKAH